MSCSSIHCHFLEVSSILSTNLILIENEWNDANRKKDVTWFERNLADDFTFVDYRTGALQSKDAWLANIRTSKSTWDLLETSELKTRVANDLGLLTGVVHLKGRDEQGQALDYSLRFTMTFTKRDRWLALAAHATPIK
jgi:ketosteroid isomerase-like protein